MMLFNPGTWVVLGVAVVALLALWQGDRAFQRQKGASVAIEKVKTNNAQLTRKADAAGRKSADAGTPGLRNPNYRD